MSYTYYEGDGTLLRTPDPHMLIGMEIYRGDRRWEPYEPSKELYLTRPIISEAEAKSRMDSIDGKEQVPQRQTGRLLDFVKRLPEDVDQAVEMLLRFEFAEPAERVDGYYEKESEGWNADSFEELQLFAMSGLIPRPVWRALVAKLEQRDSSSEPQPPVT